MAGENKNEVGQTQGRGNAPAPQSNNKVTDFSLGVFGTSDNFIMAGQMAKAVAQSTIVPKEYQGNEANAMIAIEIATRLRTSPLMVMQNLNVIQGRPSWSAQFLIAMVNGSNRYDTELQFDETLDKEGNPFACQCWTTKNGRKITGIRVDMDMAKAEGWVGKNGSKWKTMPQVMLRYRAASFFVRMNCPELALGYYTKEEVIDGDFREHPIETLEDQVQKVIQQNANSEDFNPNIIDGEVVIKESANDEPAFMQE